VPKSVLYAVSRILQMGMVYTLKQYKGHKIMEVAPGSIAEELEIEVGDILLTIDGEELEDIFDYNFMTDNESFVIVIKKANGEEWEIEIESGGEDLGLTFENSLMSDYRSCRNKRIQI